MNNYVVNVRVVNEQNKMLFHSFMSDLGDLLKIKRDIQTSINN